MMKSANVLISGWALAALAAVLVLPNDNLSGIAVRTVLGLPLVGFLPGLALLRALRLRFAPAVQTTLALGLSMALAASGGLGLNLLHALNPRGWALGLAAITLIAVACAEWWRPVRTSIVLPSWQIRHSALAVITLSVLATTMWKAHIDEASYRPFSYTAFWLTPKQFNTDLYTIGIQNNQSATETYIVRFMINGGVAGEWPNVTLGPGQQTTISVTIPDRADANAWLFLASDPTRVYRKVSVARHGWRDVG